MFTRSRLDSISNVANLLNPDSEYVHEAMLDYIFKRGNGRKSSFRLNRKIRKDTKNKRIKIVLSYTYADEKVVLYRNSKFFSLIDGKNYSDFDVSMHKLRSDAMAYYLFGDENAGGYMVETQ